MPPRTAAGVAKALGGEAIMGGWRCRCPNRRGVHRDGDPGHSLIVCDGPPPDRFPRRSCATTELYRTDLLAELQSRELVERQCPTVEEVAP